MPLDPKARARSPKARARSWIAFLLLFVFMTAASVGVYFVADLGKLHDAITMSDGQAMLRGGADTGQIDEVLRQHPSNKFVRMMAKATRSADETNATLERLSAE